MLLESGATRALTVPGFGHVLLRSHPHGFILLSANALLAGPSCRPSADLPPHGQGGALLKAAFKCGQTKLLRINSLVSPDALSAYFAFLLH